MSVLRTVKDSPGTFLFNCPGCNRVHQIWTNKDTSPNSNVTWGFNGDMNKPTFTPSLLVKWGREYVCHSFIRDGNWEFLGDCTHKLAGKTIPMEQVDT